jgi:hypothetical protein
MIIPVVSIVMGTLFLITLLMGLFGLGFVNILRGGGSTRRLRQLESQETRAFQDLQRGFKRMEERVDSLETLLLGRSTSSDSFQHDFE